MKKNRSFLFLLTLFFSIKLVAQPGPSIGLGALPSDQDSVCPIPWFTGSFNVSGYQAGDTVPDFTLYDLQGNAFNLSTALSGAVPILLVGGNYTCPVFRNKVPVINNVMNIYGNQIQVYVVYGVEAHPDIDTSVYFGYVNTGAANQQAGILYRQPVTYGERKAIVQDMLASMTIQAPVLIDGPCNNWWLNYGPAPNNAYLIRPDGVVFAKHGWFDKSPDKILCDLDSLLGTTGNCTTGSGGSGTFTLQMLTSNNVIGPEGSTLTVSANVINASSQDVELNVVRLINDIPRSWGSSLCLDVCYSTLTDSANLIVPAGTTQPFHFYFFTAAGQDTGMARVRFSNAQVSNNAYNLNMTGRTTLTTSVPFVTSVKSWQLWPSPVTGFFNLERLTNILERESIQIVDISGRVLISDHLNPGQTIWSSDLTNLNAGIYFVRTLDKVMPLLKQ